MIYLTGDTHGKFDRIEEFCNSKGTTRKDVIIILGDAGINYYGDKRDEKLKQRLASMPITLFCIHGNHENRPQNLMNLYRQHFFHGGSVLIEDAYPNIIFGLDGEVYDFNGLRTMVIGGAYSVDKEYRQMMGWNWWPDEQPDEQTKEYVENVLDFNGREMDVFLTHTGPESSIPTEAFLSGIDQSKVDKTTDLFLEHIKNTTSFKRWYFGHFHIDKVCDESNKNYVLFNSIIEFPTRHEVGLTDERRDRLA